MTSDFPGSEGGVSLSCIHHPLTQSCGVWLVLCHWHTIGAQFMSNEDVSVKNLPQKRRSLQLIPAGPSLSPHMECLPNVLGKSLASNAFWQMPKGLK